MNERIKELREQAFTMVSDEQQDHGESYEIRELWDRHDQKFAELIIQECVNVLHSNELWSRDVSDVLAKHFKVK